MVSSLSALLRGSVRLMLFAAALLAGIQVPAFVTQYEQRVDAHFSEVSQNIAGFQRTADLMFAGDLDALVNYYRNSNDAVFVSDADSVAAVVSRYRELQAEQQAMSSSSLAQAWHIAFSSNRGLLRETTEHYSYTVPLNSEALVWGLVLALLMLVCWECCIACARYCVHHFVAQKASSDIDSRSSEPELKS